MVHYPKISAGPSCFVQVSARCRVLGGLGCLSLRTIWMIDDFECLSHVANAENMS